MPNQYVATKGSIRRHRQRVLFWHNCYRPRIVSRIALELSINDRPASRRSRDSQNDTIIRFEREWAEIWKSDFENKSMFLFKAGDCDGQDYIAVKDSNSTFVFAWSIDVEPLLPDKTAMRAAHRTLEPLMDQLTGATDIL